MKLITLLFIFLTINAFGEDKSFTIFVYSKNQPSHGQGFFIKNNGITLFVTNAHVCLGHYKSFIYNVDENDWINQNKIEESSSIKYIIDVKQKKIEIDTKLSNILYDQKKDLCILKINEKIDDFLVLKENKNYNKENSFYFSGNEKKQGSLMGIQSKNIHLPYIENDIKKFYASNLSKIYWYNFKADSGNSGSPVFSTENELIGILFAIDSKKNGAVIPINELTLMLEKNKIDN